MKQKVRGDWWEVRGGEEWAARAELCFGPPITSHFFLLTSHLLLFFIRAHPRHPWSIKSGTCRRNVATAGRPRTRRAAPDAGCARALRAAIPSRRECVP